MMGAKHVIRRVTSSSENDTESSSKSTTSSNSDRDHNPSSSNKNRSHNETSPANIILMNGPPPATSTELGSDTHINVRSVSPCLETGSLQAKQASQSIQNPPQTQNQATQHTATNSQPASTQFRAIIVGGGPNGLCLAHALYLAGIDYVLLERGGEIINQGGASLALWPHSVRILDQLGLLDEARKHYFPIKTKHNHRPDGSVRDVNDMFAKVEVNHGHPWMLFHRVKLLELLWENLPEKETRVKINKKVESVVSNHDGVVVTCSDGTSESGSIVIGCDGVHSTIRQMMHDLRSQKKKRSGRKLSLGSSPNEDKSMKTYYYGLIGWIPLLDGLQPAACYEVRSEPKGKTFNILTGEDTAYFIVYVHLEKPTRERSRYTDEDAEKLAAALAESKITPEITFGDLWRSRRWGKMLDFQEGFVDKWYHERIVLVGDAVHKMTPNAGLGLNAGWQGIAELTNRLRGLVAAEGQRPDTRCIKKVFKGYQDSRKGMAKKTMRFSSLYTRVVANQSLLYRFCDWVTPAVGGDVALLNTMASPIVKKGVTFDFVAERDHKEGRVRWVHPQQCAR
ncbi:2-heptyl-3-hydroxy-4(1H)-quinolone synthase [Cytospora mali]|uniref:2-heptyl-3-hydroxy-4(1H)-quinolone synthase n=1 Tax=Cytospora mali TaxID=578113 RepID=A0A194VB25_CYTMA|nr:2-heptyl-3-hydroxy-4(1H)-quinolone synthase [Valsa mali var. pyri (nom. inval.)]